MEEDRWLEMRSRWRGAFDQRKRKRKSGFMVFFFEWFSDQKGTLKWGWWLINVDSCNVVLI